MKAYSLDLRQRIVGAADSGKFLQKEIAGLFSVTTRFVYKLHGASALFWATSSRCPHGGGRQRLFDVADVAKLGAAVEEKPDVSLKELQAQAHPHSHRRLKAS